MIRVLLFCQEALGVTLTLFVPWLSFYPLGGVKFMKEHTVNQATAALIFTIAEMTGKLNLTP